MAFPFNVRMFIADKNGNIRPVAGPEPEFAGGPQRCDDCTGGCDREPRRASATITLTLTANEASVLQAILDRVAGPSGGPRDHATSISMALEGIGVEDISDDLYLFGELFLGNPPQQEIGA